MKIVFFIGFISTIEALVNLNSLVEFPGKFVSDNDFSAKTIGTVWALEYGQSIGKADRTLKVRRRFSPYSMLIKNGFFKRNPMHKRSPFHVKRSIADQLLGANYIPNESFFDCFDC